MDKKRDFAILGFVIIGILAIFIFQNVQLSGQASRNVASEIELDLDEYLFRVGERKIIDDAGVMLVSIGDSNEAIIDVEGIRKSVNEYGARIISNVQIESIAVSDDGAILRIINLAKKGKTCSDTDAGDIYLRGKCTDRFYPDGAEDFCDFNSLKEYNCGYDEYVDEVHCLKQVVECSDGCGKGACVAK
ncbi:hypothetical protein HYV89_03605 [Candidatus Woesearchaeota archaeon]|nr:hypothetical protein [Candidatus Woesearchaeota archaeon]